MGKQLSEYKNRVIAAALQASKSAAPYTADQMAQKIRNMVEFTGIPEQDFTYVSKAIQTIVGDTYKNYL